MRRPWVIHLTGQLLMLATACFCALTLALPLAGMIGGVSAVVAPEPVFDLVEPMVCPEGARLEYELNQRSYNRPGEYELDLYCVSPGGERQNALAEGLLSMLGLSFAVTFIPLLLLSFAVLGVAAFFVVRWFLNRSEERTGGSLV
jgi:hypothetical protein